MQNDDSQDIPMESDPLEQLHGSVRRYEALFDPVAEDDWEAAR